MAVKQDIAASPQPNADRVGGLIRIIRKRKPDSEPLALDAGQKEAAKELFFRAAGNGCGIIVRRMLEMRMMEVDARNEHGETALMVASERGRNTRAVSALLAGGANPDASIEGWTAIMAATHGLHIRIIRMLVEHGANLNVQSEDGLTVLLAAMAKGGGERLVRYLVRKGADVNVPNRYGQPPLIHAAELGDLELVRFFVERGANINAIIGSMSVLSYMKKECGWSPKHREVIEFLEAHGALE